MGQDVIRLKLLRPDEVAAILRLSKTRVYQLAKRGIIPFIKIGKSIRFILEDVYEFIRLNRRDQRGK